MSGVDENEDLATPGERPGGPDCAQPGRQPSAAERPDVLHELSGPDFIERWCQVPCDLECFPGHFPGAPIVPGVLQLDWAMELVGLLLGATPAVEEIEFLKLRAPLRPEQRFRIRARRVPEVRFDFQLWSASGEHAKGRIRLAGAEG